MTKTFHAKSYPLPQPRAPPPVPPHLRPRAVALRLQVVLAQHHVRRLTAGAVDAVGSRHHVSVKQGVFNYYPALRDSPEKRGNVATYMYNKNWYLFLGKH